MNPIICAIDKHNLQDAIDLIREVYELVGSIKLGLEFFIANGINGIKEIILQFPKIKIFLDLKFHDIPNTVVGALKSIIDIENIFLTTIHAQGGVEMIKKSVEAASNVKIIAVTKLTSLALNQEEIISLTELALLNGAHGIVCPAEICAIIRAKFSERKFIIVTPGIRMTFDSKNDQIAVSTPGQAIANGSDYLVIGRPITQAIDKKLAIAKIIENINHPLISTLNVE